MKKGYNIVCYDTKCLGIPDNDVYIVIVFIGVIIIIILLTLYLIYFYIQNSS